MQLNMKVLKTCIAENMWFNWYLQLVPEIVELSGLISLSIFNQSLCYHFIHLNRVETFSTIFFFLLVWTFVSVWINLNLCSRDAYVSRCYHFICWNPSESVSHISPISQICFHQIFFMHRLQICNKIGKGNINKKQLCLIVGQGGCIISSSIFNRCLCFQVPSLYPRSNLRGSPQMECTLSASFHSKHKKQLS